MSEQQYRVIADRDKGDDPRLTTPQDGDVMWWRALYGGAPRELVRIERPVSTGSERESTGVFGADIDSLRTDLSYVGSELTLEEQARESLRRAMWPRKPTEEAVHGAIALAEAESVTEQKVIDEPQTKREQVISHLAAMGQAMFSHPPVPTREQIAAEVKRVTHAWSGPSMAEFADDPPTRKQYAIADAVLALFQSEADR